MTLLKGDQEPKEVIFRMIIKCNFHDRSYYKKEDTMHQKNIHPWIVMVCVMKQPQTPQRDTEFNAKAEPCVYIYNPIAMNFCTHFRKKI